MSMIYGKYINGGNLMAVYEIEVMNENIVESEE